MVMSILPVTVTYHMTPTKPNKTRKSLNFTFGCLRFSNLNLEFIEENCFNLQDVGRSRHESVRNSG